MSLENKTHRALVIYVNAAADLADSIKRDIQKKGYVTDPTVLALNKFIIASNNINDMTNLIKDLTKDLN